VIKQGKGGVLLALCAITKCLVSWFVFPPKVIVRIRNIKFG